MLGNQFAQGMCESLSSLKDLLDQRRLTINQVRTWACALAAELCTLHEHGQVHGAIAVESVWIEGNSAHLGPACGHASANQPNDIVQFAALLRRMLDSVPVESEAVRASWRELDRIAATNSRAGSGSRMKKVALALRLLCSARKFEVRTRTELPAGELVRQEAPERRSQRILMLVREVPPVAPAHPHRFVAKTIHVGAVLASAASIAVTGCIMFLRFTR
jgi:hypothetical protein